MNLFSTEQVSKYHPDKYADYISDSLVRLALLKNPQARCAIETMVKDSVVIVAGEIGGATLTEEEVRNAIKGIGKSYGYEVKKVINLLGTQSHEISKAVDNEKDMNSLGAGDQGFMVGFATRETKSYLPKAFDIANNIIATIELDIILNHNSILKGDAKTQVTIDLDTNEIHKVLVSVCTKEGYGLGTITRYIKELLKFIPSETLIINPSGVWNVGGPLSDSGLTGRKIVADQYGGFTPVGGGAFSGKDLTKVDRSGAYAARNIAIDVINQFPTIQSVEIQLAYAIGIAEPMSVNVKLTHVKDSTYPTLNTEVEDFISKNYDLRPSALIKKLNLKPDDYPRLARGCHFRNGYVGNWNNQD